MKRSLVVVTGAALVGFDLQSGARVTVDDAGRLLRITLPRAEVVSVACPLPSSTPEPMLVTPSKKFTVPVGVPVAGGTGATVAVNVTAAPDATEARTLLAPGVDPSV